MTSPEQLYTGASNPATDANPLLPAEFQYAGQPTQIAQLNDPQRFYIPHEPAAQGPDQVPPSAPGPSDAQGRPIVGPPDYQGSQDKQWPLNQDMRNDEGSFGPTWLLDRGTGLLGAAIAAARFDPRLAQKLPLGSDWPSAASMGSIGRSEWQGALSSQYGRLLGGAYVADSAIDQLFFADKTSSAATMAVDFGVPMAARWLLSRYSLPVSLGLSIAAHVGEKFFLEDKR